MFQFIYWLKAFATVFITNSHYANIWPVPAMAMGGHLGNCLFFLVSGFCMYRIKDNFVKWYAKRIIRIYPALWIVATIDFLIGRNSAHGIMAYIHCYIFPTWYHFIASIMLLYAAFYAVRWVQQKCRIHMLWCLGTVAAVFFLMYWTQFDRSYYHVDDVEENWVRFQFFFCMLAGAYLRDSYDRISDRLTAGHMGWLAALTVVYFAAKIGVSRFGALAEMQFLSPVTLVVLTIYLTVICIKLEKRGFFRKLPGVLNKSAVFLAGITLEIYLCQPSVIYYLEGLPFPIDFILVTGLIVVYAWVVHRCADWIQKGCSKGLKL